MAEYAGSEMLVALEQLHRFRERRRKKGKTMKQEYDEQREHDLKLLEAMDPGQQAAFVKTMLHYHRRVVSHFYQRIYWLLKNKALPQRVVFGYWSSVAELRKILEKTLLPIGWDPPQAFRELIEMAERVRGPEPAEPDLPSAGDPGPPLAPRAKKRRE
jgi:hypothetical protein